MITLVEIPKIDEMLANLHKSLFFTSLDMGSRYYQIKLSPETQHKSVFTIILVKYKFLRMSFGLAQGLVYFTDVIQKVLGQFNDFCFFYMDDVLVHDSNEDHLEHLNILIRIRDADLKLKHLKHAFLKRHLQ